MVMIRDHVKRMIGRPVVIALGIAIFSVSAMLMVDHGPWSRPKVQHIYGTNYTTTGEAARAVGATVAPTAPKGKFEPVPPGPKPAEPAKATEGAAEH
jgi:hypothetical protein